MTLIVACALQGAERKIRDEERKKKMSQSEGVTKTENNTANSKQSPTFDLIHKLDLDLNENLYSPYKW